MSKVLKRACDEDNTKLSDHSYEELAALHTISKILAQPGDLRDQLEQK